MKTALWTSLAIILLCATAFAQQANILQPYCLPQFASDVRLRQPVTFTALSVPLSDALQELSGQTGVALRAGRGVGQWRLVARVQNLPLADLLASIAYAFDLSWRVAPGKEGQPPGYEIFQSPAQAQRERGEFEERVRLLQRILPQALAEAQRRIERGETGKELVPTDRTDGNIISHYAYGFVIQPKLRVAAALLTPEAINRLVAGEDIYVPGSAFTPQQQQMLLSPMAGVEIEPPARKQVLQVRWQYEPWHSELSVRVLSRTENGGGSSSTGFPLPPLPIGGKYALYDTTDLRTLMSSDELRRTLPVEGTPPKHLTVPELLHRLSVMVPVNVVAEYYPLSMQLWYPSGAGRNAQEVLQILLQRNFYQPQRAGNTLLFSAKNRYERRLCDVPASSIRRWLNADGWFGLRVQSLQEIAKLTPFQQRALGIWASAEADRFGGEGDYRAVVYDTLSSLTYAEGTAEGIWRLLTALPPAAQLRALSGQQVVINDFARVVKLPLEDLTPPFFPIDVAQALPSERIWVQAKRAVTQRWACEKPRFESVRRLIDLWLSTPGETLADFRRRLRAEQKVDSDRFVQVEVETVTLRLGAGNKALVDPEIQLARFKRGSGTR
ncbi:MAG: hypothetical protein KatS3mg022_2591 [Armatimonadota bacterium]|nr:MAG: hypothetical protein KatS3mg022_2591 [Armatimonadota bacterium]